MVNETMVEYGIAADAMRRYWIRHADQILERTEEMADIDSLENDLRLLEELRIIAKRKHEIWEEDTLGIGLTWRGTPLALEYQALESRVWEIKEELFGDYAIEV